MKRTAGVIVALVATGLLTAACGGVGVNSGPGTNSSNGSGGPSSSAGATSGASSAAGSPAASTSTGKTTAPATPGPPAPACDGDDLLVSSKPLSSAAGHEGVIILITNNGDADCSLIGYPGADGLDDTQHSIGSAKRTLDGMLGGCNCAKPVSVTIAPDQVASAVVEANIGGPGSCDAFGGLLVTPPNTSTSTPLSVKLPSCGFEVHPVVAGTTGGSPA